MSIAFQRILFLIPLHVETKIAFSQNITINMAGRHWKASPSLYLKQVVEIDIFTSVSVSSFRMTISDANPFDRAPFRLRLQSRNSC